MFRSTAHLKIMRRFAASALSLTHAAPVLFYGLPDRRASHCAEPQARVSGRLCVPGSTSIPVMPGISFVTSLFPQKFFPLRMPCGSSPLLCFFPAQAFDRDLIHLSADRHFIRAAPVPLSGLRCGAI